MKLAQLSTIKLHLAMLTVELLTVQTSYFRESNTNYIRNFVSKFHPALQRTGEVLPVTHPTWGSEPQPERWCRSSVRASLSSQTPLQNRTSLATVTKSNLNLHRVLHVATFIPLSVVGSPLPPLGRSGAHRSWTNRAGLNRDFLTLQLRFLPDLNKKGLLKAFQLIGGEREKQPGQ